MHINISTRLLRAFLTLHECRHFGQAAERLCVSQSAFSVMIQKLEAVVGARLFERDTRKVTLTAEGALFVDVARALVDDIDAAFSGLGDYIARRKGRVSIAALPSLAAHGLPAVIARYRQQYPGITVALHDALSEQCLALLRDGKVDLAVTAPVANMMEFATHSLHCDRFYLICRRDHRLAGKSTITVEDLAGCEMIHLSKSTSVRRHADELLENVAVVDSGLEVEFLATVAGLIESGLGVSLVPGLTLFQFRQRDLVAIPLAASPVLRPILIATRRDRSLSIAAQGLYDLIAAELDMGAAGRATPVPAQ